MARPAPEPLGITVAGTVPDFAPLTDQTLRNPAPGDWPILRRDYAASSFSPLDQITAANVDRLELAWIWPMRDGGTNEPAPLAYRGTVYLMNNGGFVQALDGASGELVWEQHLAANVAMRGMALYDDKLIVQSNAHLIALDARTGEVAWDVQMPDGKTSSSGPLAADGLVIEGMGGCSTYEQLKCFISAYDARTGEQSWRFATIATSDKPGGDTWGDLPDLYRAGGETWITGSFDPELGLTYWGVAQAKPWMPASRGMGGRDAALYTSSTVALDVQHRQARVALPALAGRGARSRRGVRARARRCRRPTNGCSRSARTACSGSSTGARASTRSHGDAVPERVGRASIARRASRAIGRTSSSTRSASGSTAVRAPKAATTGRRRAFTSRRARC